MSDVARRAIVILRTARASLRRAEECHADSVVRTRQFMAIASSELMLAQEIVCESSITSCVEGQLVVVALALQFLLDSSRVSDDALLKGIDVASSAIKLGITELNRVTWPVRNRYSGP
jgi:hypothetical protein